MIVTRVRRPVSRSAAVAQSLTIFGMPADRETIFSDHRGFQKPRIEKRQRKLIAKSALIKFFLHSGERLRCLTTAYAPVDLLEKILTGPAVLLFRRSLMIFTDQRILHVPTRFDRSPHSAVSQIAYEDLAAVDLKGRTLVVHYKNGRQEAFAGIGRPERKKIKNLLDELPLTPKGADHLKGRIHLCPSCSEPLAGAGHSCPGCKMQFKSERQASWRAWLVPGGGYFFSLHPMAGVMVGSTECVLAGLAGFAWSAFSKALPVSIGMLVLPLGGLIALKSFAAFHARRLIGEYMPVNQDYIQRKH